MDTIKRQNTQIPTATPKKASEYSLKVFASKIKYKTVAMEKSPNNIKTLAFRLFSK